MPTAAQSRAARALLDWKLSDLSERTGLTVHALSAFERGRPMRESNLAKVSAALEAAGIVFVDGKVGTGALLRSQTAEAA